MLKRISGPVVTAVGFNAHMYDVVKVGNEKLMGEVIKITGENIIIQVYEATDGIRPGEPVENTGMSRFFFFFFFFHFFFFFLFLPLPAPFLRSSSALDSEEHLRRDSAPARGAHG